MRIKRLLSKSLISTLLLLKFFLTRGPEAQEDRICILGAYIIGKCKRFGFKVANATYMSWWI